jgi:hypothetical protein
MEKQNSLEEIPQNAQTLFLVLHKYRTYMMLSKILLGSCYVVTAYRYSKPLQALTGPEDSRSLRLPDFKTIGT